MIQHLACTVITFDSKLCRSSVPSRETCISTDRPGGFHPSYDDASLIAQIRGGDEEALRVLYLRYYSGLVGFVLRYVSEVAVAEEIVQDVFLSIWAKRESWAPTQGLEAYLFGAVRNRALNVGRAAASAARFAPDVIFALTPSQLSADEAVLAGDRAEAVRAAVSALPAQTREAVTLRWLNGFSYPAVASVLGISEEAARKVVTRAAARLRDLLRDYAD